MKKFTPFVIRSNGINVLVILYLILWRVQLKWKTLKIYDKEMQKSLKIFPKYDIFAKFVQ